VPTTIHAITRTELVVVVNFIFGLLNNISS